MLPNKTLSKSPSPFKPLLVFAMLSAYNPPTKIDWLGLTITCVDKLHYRLTISTMMNLYLQRLMTIILIKLCILLFQMIVMWNLKNNTQR
jgi:hypothetical protein